MSEQTRRAFIGNVGKGMLLATLGTAVSREMRIGTAWAGDGPDAIHFGAMEGLVNIMADTPVQKLQPLLVAYLNKGTYNLRQLVAAASLANARKFGGEDYIGYHALMAMAPAYHMAQEMRGKMSALPVLKVLYRNTDHIQNNGGGRDVTLKSITAVDGKVDGPTLAKTILDLDIDLAEAQFAKLCQGSPQEAFDFLQYAVQDDIEVHQIVLAHRSYSMLDFVGKEHAHTMLRETVRFCVDRERRRKRRGRPAPGIRAVLPKVMAEYGLETKVPGNRKADDAWVRKLSKTIYTYSREGAARAVAAVIKDGYRIEDVGEAISLAANELQLRDRGPRQHGASLGVHASDSAHAWRGVAKECNDRNRIASMVVGAYHICRDGKHMADPYPLASHKQDIKTDDADKLLAHTKEAILANDQGQACAAVDHYIELGHDTEAVFAMMRDFAISEDGRLHSEKYYVTVRDCHRHTRPAFRKEYLLGLTRATASAYSYSLNDVPGHRAPGYEEAVRLLRS